MQTAKFLYWQEEDMFIGYFLDYPDYWTQGETLDDLKDHLRDLYDDLTSGQIPGIRKVDELVVAGTQNHSNP
jgi:hypothetical protein